MGGRSSFTVSKDTVGVPVHGVLDRFQQYPQATGRLSSGKSERFDDLHKGTASSSYLIRDGKE